MTVYKIYWLELVNEVKIEEKVIGDEEVKKLNIDKHTDYFGSIRKKLNGILLFSLFKK